MNVPTTDSLDRFLDLSAKLHIRMASREEREEWRSLLHHLVDGEVGARARQNPHEGRRHLRTAVRLASEVRSADGKPLHVNVSLGTGGLKLHAALPFEVGAHLDIAIALPEHTLSSKARVAWKEPEALGVELLDLKEEDRELLEGAVIEAMLKFQ